MFSCLKFFKLVDQVRSNRTFQTPRPDVSQFVQSRHKNTMSAVQSNIVSVRDQDMRLPSNSKVLHLLRRVLMGPPLMARTSLRVAPSWIL